MSKIGKLGEDGSSIRHSVNYEENRQQLYGLDAELAEKQKSKL